MSYDPEDAFDLGADYGQNFMNGVTSGFDNYQNRPVTWLTQWPSALMHATSAGFQSVGVGWIDDILRGMGGQTALSGDVKSTLDSTFKSWWGALKETFGNPGGNVRRDFQSWMDAWMGMATTTAGESMGSIATRMLDSALAMGGSGVAAVVAANKDLFLQIMGETANEVVGGAFDAVDKLVGLAGSFGGLGSAAAERYRTQKIAPEQEKLALLEAELSTLEQQGAVHQVIALKVREIEEQKALIAANEEKILALQQAQADLGWLQAQLDVIKMATDNQINLAGLLPSGFQFGLGADPEQILAVMTALVQQLVQAANSSIPSYAVGTSYVPRTGLAMLHRGESVIPAGGRPPITMNFTYAPALSTIDRHEAEYVLRPLIEDAVRTITG
jgi:hypothetical protein